MGSIAQQEPPPIAQALDDALVHLEGRHPVDIGYPHLDAGPGVEQCTELGGRRKRLAGVGLVAIDEDQPALVRQGREQNEAGRSDDQPAALRRAGQANLRIGDPVATVVGPSGEMLLHRMTGDAVAAAGAQHVSHRNGLAAGTGLERHAHALRMVFDRFNFSAEFDLEAKALQTLAQDRLGAPLRKAALESIGAAGIGEIVAGDLAQPWTQQLDAL